MCELTCSVERDVSDGNSGSGVDDWDHNAWIPILPTLLKLLRDEEAGRVGISCHFALDVVTYAMGG